METTDSHQVEQAERSPLEALTNPELEYELATSAARVAAATCRYLLAVAEYDRRRGWEDWECHDMAGYLAWRCAISPATARDHVRVATALFALPLIKETFSRGALSYSQVRALCRVATTETEKELLDLATSATAAQLETVVRAYRRVLDAAEDKELYSHRKRHVTCHFDDEGDLVGSFRMRPDQGAIFAGAIARLTDSQSVREAEEDGARDPQGAARLDALLELVEAGASELASGTSSDDESRYFVKVIAPQEQLEKTPASEDGPEEGSGAKWPPEPPCEIEGGIPIPAETARRLACSADYVVVKTDRNGGVLDLGRKTRRPSRALRRALSLRDRHCRFPGCTRTRTQAHHYEYWTDGGETKLSNLFSFCSRHHHRLHEGGYRMEMKAHGSLVFFRPDGTPIEEVPKNDGLSKEGLCFLDEAVSPVDPEWDGTRLDTGYVVDNLLQLTRPFKGPGAVSAETISAASLC